MQGAQLRLEWSGGIGPFQLQDAASPNGPWLNVGTPISGTNIAVDLLLSPRFFRVAGVSTADDLGEQAMRDTLLTLQTFVNSVPTADRPAWRAALLTFLKARPDISVTGETPDGVYAITTDGIPIAIWNNRLPDPFDPEDLVGQFHVLGTQTPGNTAARFATTVGSGGFNLAGPRLGRQLSAHGYSASFDAAPLESLLGPRNESVFFFNTHGGLYRIPLFGPDGEPLGVGNNSPFELAYGLWTGTKMDPQSRAPNYDHAAFLAEVRDKRLAMALAAVSYTTDDFGKETANNEYHFAITAEWVRQYMTFPRENHASIWLAACRSASPPAAAMRNAFLAAGAEMVSSWTANVGGGGVISATSFLFDRLLGANEVVPPATPQRPFGYEDSWTELRAKGLHKHPATDDQNLPTITEIVYQGVAGGRDVWSVCAVGGLRAD